MAAEKYKELYEYSKDVYKETLMRNVRADAKATRYITSITFILSIYALFVKWVIAKTIPPEGIDYIVLVLSVITLISLVCAWCLLFYTIRLRSLKKLPLTKRTIDFFKRNNIGTIYYSLSKRLEELNSHNKQKIDKKYRWLNRGYRAMMISGVLIISLTIVLGIDGYYEITKFNIEKSIKNSTKQR